MNRFCYLIYKSSIDDGLLVPGDKLIVSLSGGIDSLSLCCLLDEFREKIDIEIRWAHFNHGIRKESDSEESFVRELALSKNIPLDVVKTDKFRSKNGMQQKAREWRYDNLMRLFHESESTKIALGHHLNDLVETQIWRLIRGASLFSFNPMQKINTPFIRPLLHIPKSDLKEYLESIGQIWCEDASNKSSDYTRNEIRNDIIPMLQKCAGGNLEEKFLGIDRDARLLKEMFENSVPAETYQSNSLPYAEIMAVPALFAHEMIHRFLIYNGQTEVTRANIDLIYRQIQANLGNWSIDLKGQVQIVGKHKKITID